MAMRLVVTSESLSFLIPDGKGLYDSKAVEVDDMRSKGERNRTGLSPWAGHRSSRTQCSLLGRR